MIGRRLNQTGDTIIEVLVAIAIVSSVLGSVFVAMNQGAQNIRQSQEHEEALKISESQLEYLARYLNDLTKPDINRDATHRYFCMGPADFEPKYFDSSVTALPAALADYPADCKQDIAGAYAYYYGIERIDDTFYVHVIWDGPTGSRERVNVVYKMYKAVSATSSSGTLALARFEMELSNRGTDAYPDDVGLNGTLDWIGGYSLQNTSRGDRLYSASSWTGLHLYTIPGDALTTALGLSAMVYSKSNQTYLSGVYSFIGAPWEKHAFGLDATQLYVFVAYPLNVLAVVSNPVNADVQAEPQVNTMPSSSQMNIDGMSVGPRWHDAARDQKRHRLSAFFPSSSQSVGLQIYDHANQVQGDDLAVKRISFYECI